jgi:hypothetical protein
MYRVLAHQPEILAAHRAPQALGKERPRHVNHATHWLRLSQTVILRQQQAFCI